MQLSPHEKTVLRTKNISAEETKEKIEGNEGLGRIKMRQEERRVKKRNDNKLSRQEKERSKKLNSIRILCLRHLMGAPGACHEKRSVSKRGNEIKLVF